MLNLRNTLQHSLDLNANVTHAVLITVKTKSLSNQLKTFSCFNVNPLLRKIHYYYYYYCYYYYYYNNNYYYYYLTRI